MALDKGRFVSAYTPRRPSRGLAAPRRPEKSPVLFTPHGRVVGQAEVASICAELAESVDVPVIKTSTEGFQRRETRPTGASHDWLHAILLGLDRPSVEATVRGIRHEHEHGGPWLQEAAITGN